MNKVIQISIIASDTAIDAISLLDPCRLHIDDITSIINNLKKNTTFKDGVCNIFTIYPCCKGCIGNTVMLVEYLPGIRDSLSPEPVSTDDAFVSLNSSCASCLLHETLGYCLECHQ